MFLKILRMLVGSKPRPQHGTDSCCQKEAVSDESAGSETPPDQQESGPVRMGLSNRMYPDRYSPYFMGRWHI